MAVQKCCILFLLGIAFISTATSSIFDPDAEDYGTEINSVVIDIKPGTTYIEYDNEGIWICPETFQLTFDLESKPFSIHLVRAAGTRSAKLPIIVYGDNKAWMQERKRQQYCNYQDIYTNSAFTITLEETNYILDGTFRKMGKFFGIRPRELHVERTRRSTDNYQEHSLLLLSEDDGISEFNDNQQRRLRRNSKVRYEVELLAFIDYSVYERFEKFIKWNATTEEKLAYHFSHILNEVSLRYAGITDQDYEISVQIAGLVAAKNPLGSPWTKESSTRSEISRLLEKFKFNLQHVLPGLIKLPSYDHAMLFTQKVMYNSFDSMWGTLTQPLGKSHIGGICNENATSVVENSNMFETVWTATHELGHNLGAWHDGLHNYCLETNMYVMTPIIKARSAENYRNIYQFSSCSKRSMKTNLADLSESNSCLFETTAWDNTVIKKQLGAPPPGQIYTLDEQCQAAYKDTRSYFCGTQLHADTICGHLICWDPKKVECDKLFDMPANQGTTCGNKKWCVDGKCVYNNTAPSANSNCLFGDSKEVYHGLTCRDMPRLDLCYHTVIRKACCESCGMGSDPFEVRTHNNLQPAIPGLDGRNNENIIPNNNRTEENCTFGDDVNARIEGVKCEVAIKKSPFLCYNSTYRGLCCASCAALYQPDEVGCEYGDTHRTCSDTAIMSCALHMDQCCKSCKKYKVAIEVIFGNNPKNGKTIHLFHPRATKKPVQSFKSSNVRKESDHHAADKSSSTSKPIYIGAGVTIGLLLIGFIFKVVFLPMLRSKFERTESTDGLVKNVFAISTDA